MLKFIVCVPLQFYNFTICICRKIEREIGFDFIRFKMNHLKNFHFPIPCAMREYRNGIGIGDSHATQWNLRLSPSIGHMQLSNSNAFWLLLLLYLNTINFDYLFETFYNFHLFIIKKHHEQNSNSIRVHFVNYIICIKLTLFHFIPTILCSPILSANQRMDSILWRLTKYL